MTSNELVNAVAVTRAVSSLTALSDRYARVQLSGGDARQELHVLRLSYNALGVVLGVRTPNERTEEEQAEAEAGYERHVLGILGPPCDCEEQVALIYDTCESGEHKP